MALYACTVFLGAFLLFLVQPIVARAILPWFGGSPAVWTACMLFFQLVLLGGYAYAAATLARLGPRRAPGVHLALLALGLAFLPIVPDPGWKPEGAGLPIARILGLLAATVGLPYFLLSASAPLLQAWAWTASRHGRGSPYRLYALSNAGSVLALAAYPFGLEPLLDTTAQAHLWSAGYVLYALLCGWIAVQQLRAAPRDLPAVEGDGSAAERDGHAVEGVPDLPPTASVRLLWVALAAVAVVLLLSVTNLMCQEIAVVPFLWMLPLAVYLFSMILCFAGDWWYWRPLYQGLLIPTVCGFAYTLSRMHKIGLPLVVLGLSAGLFVACMVCHGEAVLLKPHPRRLTSFYLHLSIGGALGGLYVSVLAPWLIPFPFELQLGLTACAALAGLALLHRPYPWLSRFCPPWLVLVVGQGIALTLGAVLLEPTREGIRGYHFLRRNFYGVVKVRDYEGYSESPPLRTLVHGITRHGEQIRIPAQRREPTSYYARSSGVGIALTEHRRSVPQRVGVVGLGAGTLAAYGRERDVYRFYEINPIVEKVAREEFSFLGDSPAHVDVVLGDARLSMEREDGQEYDVLAVDAFSSDAIPVHLLTLEAFRTYFRHLKADGILAVHVSNRALDLAPVVRALADALEKETVEIDNDEDDTRAIMSSDWVLVTTNRAFLDLERVKKDGAPAEARPGFRPWTDAYSNLLEIVKWEKWR